MKKKWLFFLAIIVVVVGSFLSVKTVKAISCEGVSTSIIECGNNESGIGHILGLVITIMSVGIGVLGVIGITIAGVQYLTAKDNEEQVRKAKRRIVEIMIGLAAYAVMAGLLTWLLPGGIPDPGEVPHYGTPDSSDDSGVDSDDDGDSEDDDDSEDDGEYDDSEDDDDDQSEPTIQYDAKLSLEKGDSKVDYWLNIPNNATDGMPLVVFLHGKNETGHANSVKNLPQTKYITNSSRPYIAIAPVLKKIDGYWTGNVASVKKIIDKVVSDYKINKDRIYIVGFSMGAAGTWRIVNNYPDLFAAAVPISGGHSSAKAENFKHTKIYAAAGSKESSKVSDMTKFVEEINKVGGSATMHVYSGKNHSGMQNSIDYDVIFEWLLKQ